MAIYKRDGDVWVDRNNRSVGKHCALVWPCATDGEWLCQEKDISV